MARINIEDKWWNDPRRDKLGRLVGSLFIADGLMFYIWRVSQDYWKKAESPVPIDIFESIEMHEKVVEARLAEKTENGYYVKGSGEFHGWIKSRNDAASAAGKASAASRINKYGSSQPLSNQTRTKREPNRTKPEPSSSSSSSSSKKKEEIHVNAVASTSDESVQGLRVEDLADLWNERKHPVLPAVAVLTEARKRKAKVILKKYPEKEFWIDLIEEIKKSNFLLGLAESKNTGKPWRANFDWILSPDSIAKLLEGYYQ